MKIVCDMGTCDKLGHDLSFQESKSYFVVGGGGGGLFMGRLDALWIIN